MINQTRPFIDSLESLFIAAPIEPSAVISNTEGIETLSFADIFTGNLEQDAGQKDAALNTSLPVESIEIESTYKADEIEVEANATIETDKELVASQNLTSDNVQVKKATTETVKKSAIDEQVKITNDNEKIIVSEKNESDEQLQYDVMMTMLQQQTPIEVPASGIEDIARMQAMLEHISSGAGSETTDETHISSSVYSSEATQNSTIEINEALLQVDKEQEVRAVNNEIAPKIETTAQIETDIKTETRVDAQINTAAKMDTDFAITEAMIAEGLNPLTVQNSIEQNVNYKPNDTVEIKPNIVQTNVEQTNITTNNTIQINEPKINITSADVAQTTTMQTSELKLEQPSVKQKKIDTTENEVSTSTTRSKEKVIQDYTAITSVTPTISTVNLNMNPMRYLPQVHDNVVPFTVETNLMSPQWGEEVADKISFMLSNKQNSASLQLDPPELGPLMIKVTMHEDGARLFFGSEHKEVRAAIENAMPHLNDMMKENGVSLMQVDVGANFSQSHLSQENKRSEVAHNDKGNETNRSDNADEKILRKNLSDGLVDIFI
jgi:flagellar hook-length control protein FliK